MTLKDRTRRPTGAVPWPLILVEGPEKAGKTFTSALLAKSDRVGQMYWIDLGEGAADEYGAIPGVDYLIVEHDGSWASIYQSVEDVREEARKVADAKGKPVVLLLDGMNAEWDMHKDWASARARSTQTNRAALERDPNAEVKIPQNCWNDANARHRQLMRLLMTFPGIVIMTARGKLVSAVDERGRPIEGKKDYRVEGQKDLGFDASAWIRLSRDKPAIIVGARSVHMGIRPGKDDPVRLDRDWTVEQVIFDVLKCDPATARVRDYVELVPDLTPEVIREEALKPATDFQRIKELYAYVNAHFPGVTMTGGTGSEELLLHIIKRAGDERLAADSRRQPHVRPAAQQAGRNYDQAAYEAEAAGVDGEAEKTWVTGWFERLSRSATDDDWALRRSEVELAVTGKEITPGTAGELREEITQRTSAGPGQAAA